MTAKEKTIKTLIRKYDSLVEQFDRAEKDGDFDTAEDLAEEIECIEDRLKELGAWPC